MNLWCPEDVSRILAATEDTLSSVRSAVPSLDPETANAYHLGFLDAIQAIAVAFGLHQPPSRARSNSRRTHHSWALIDNQFLDAPPAIGQRNHSLRRTLDSADL